MEFLKPHAVTGWHKNLPMQDYLDHPYINSSLLKHMLSTPADFKAAMTQKSTNTRSTTLGSAIHAAILEPEIFAQNYALQPENWGKKNSGEGKKKWDAFKKEHSDKIVLDHSDALVINEVMTKVHDHPILQGILYNALIETTGYHFWQDRIGIKARPDIISGNHIWDIKITSEGISDWELERTIKKYAYDFKIAHHLFVMSQCDLEFDSVGWIFISVNTPTPHIVIKRCLPERLLMAGAQHRTALRTLQECILFDDWHGYDTNIGEI